MIELSSLEKFEEKKHQESHAYIREKYIRDVGPRKKLSLLKDKSKSLVEVAGILYELVQPLKGRGHGTAGIYRRSDGRLYIIKQDDPAVCVLEGSAHWVKKLTHYKSKTNFAQCSTLRHMNNEEEYVISIQPLVENAKPLDEIVFGRKRIPWLPVSEEFIAEYIKDKRISQFLATLPNQVQLDVAMETFETMAAGDESQHLGQIVAIIDEKTGNIRGTRRIDGGARERHSKYRQETQDFHPKRTSVIYAKSGQIGKDYISYPLKNRGIYTKYIYLWATLDPKRIAKATSKNIKYFRAAMAKITDSKKNETLNRIYDIYTKGSQTSERKKNQNITQAEIEGIILTVVPARLKQMHQEARDEIDSLLNVRCKDFKDIKNLRRWVSAITRRDHIDIPNFLSVLRRYLPTLVFKKLFRQNLDKQWQEVSNNIILSECHDCLSYLHIRCELEYPDSQKNRDILFELELFQIRISILKILTECHHHPDLIERVLKAVSDFEDPNKIIEEITLFLEKDTEIPSLEPDPIIEAILLLKKEVEKYNKLIQTHDQDQAKIRQFELKSVAKDLKYPPPVQPPKPVLPLPSLSQTISQTLMPKPKQRISLEQSEQMDLQARLIAACKQGDEKAVIALLKQGARPDLSDARSEQPLGAAVWGMCPGVVDALLEQLEGVAPITWKECEAHNLERYQEMFIVTELNPMIHEWLNYRAWFDVMYKIQNKHNLFVQAFHLEKVNEDSSDKQKIIFENFEKLQTHVAIIINLAEGGLVSEKENRSIRRIQQAIATECASLRMRIKQRIESAKQPTPRVSDEKMTLCYLLHLVADGEQDKAEKLIVGNKALLLQKGTVKDLSGREFKQISAFQYALWAMDWHMWTMMRVYLPLEAQAAQLKELESKGTAYGSHFNIKGLTDALQIYRDKDLGHMWWFKSPEIEAWCVILNSEQQKLPVHVVNEYCRLDRSFRPCPSEWASKLPRSRQAISSTRSDVLLPGQSGSWFEYLTLPKNGLDHTRVLIKSEKGVVYNFRTKVNGINANLKAIQSLWETRTKQLEVLKSECGLLSGVNQTPSMG